MEARELRIGNWVKQGRANVQVTGAMIQEINQELLYVDPIPLTEERLLKFGFDLIPFVAPSQSCGVDLYHGYNYAVLKIGYKTELILRYKSDFSKIRIEGFYSSELKYVHQLQNLYFALTGEELTIKQTQS